jgi:hypothetical protein
MGTAEPSMVDIHAFVYIERIFYMEGSAFGDVFEQLNFRETAPSLEPFINRIREHPLLRDEVMSIKGQHQLFDDVRNSGTRPVLQIKYLD